MKDIEPILSLLEELFIEKLPLYIEKINKEANDGIMLKAFENKKLFETCNKLPCFKVSFEKAECTEKDRVLEIDVYRFCFEIKYCNTNNNKIIELLRYAKAIDNMLQNEEMPNNILDIKILSIEKNHFILYIQLN